MTTRRAACLSVLPLVALACAAETPVQFGGTLDGGARPPDARVDAAAPRDLGGRSDTPVAPVDRGVIAVDDRPAVEPSDVANIYDTGTGSDACAVGAACTARPGGRATPRQTMAAACTSLPGGRAAPRQAMAAACTA